jgi:hypothetical protein
MTKVIFLIEADLPADFSVQSTDVFAFFPEVNESGFFKTAYNSIGQHSGCSVAYAKSCKEAKYNQYSDLLKELVKIGYKHLDIQNSQTVEVHRQPTASEIKFGYGATHWLTYPLSKILNKKGEIKKWFINPNDRLRYSTK